MFITFRDIWMSKPEVFQDTAMVKLGASAQVLGQAGGLFSSGANLTSQLSGRSQTAQSGQATALVSQGAQLATGVTQTANLINNSGQVMKAAKARLTALVTLARSQGFLVDLNTGVVKPNPGMASGPHAAAFAAQAVKFNANIQTVVFQVNAQDIASKLALAKTALDVVNFVMGVAKGSGSTTTDPNLAPVPTAGSLPTTGTLPSGTVPTGVGGTTSGLTGTGPMVGSGGISNLTQPVGAGAHYGLAGAGSLGVDQMGGAGAHGIGAAGLNSLGTGTGAAGVSSLSGANQPSSAAGTGATGQSGASGGSMVGMGGGGMGGAAGRDKERRESTAWRQLTEDEDLWGGDDIPDTNDGVLA